MKIIFIFVVCMLPWVMLGGYLLMGVSVAWAFKFAGTLTMMFWPVAALVVILFLKKSGR